jgi:hypothetical protein
MAVNETLTSSRTASTAPSGPGWTAIVVNAPSTRSRFSKADAQRLRTAAENGHRPEAAGALRAALTGVRCARARSARTCAD